MASELLAIPLVLALAIILGIVSFFGIVIGLPVFLHFRLKAIQIKGGQAKQVKELCTKIQALESRCNGLEQQLLEINTAMADEGRQLDLKLSAVLDAQEGENEQKVQQQGQ